MSQVAASSATAAAALPAMAGGDISKLLKSQGPVVSAVLLKADATVQELDIDTTPQKQMVQKTLGGPFTFLGQYEEEGIMLMCLRDNNNEQGAEEGNNLPVNQHKLQPPFDEAQVRGDILCLRVAAEEDENDNVDTLASKSNEEFFLNYTKDEYMAFAARTDIEVPNNVVSEDADEEHDDGMESSEEEEVEGESDEEDEDAEAGFMQMLMGQVIQRFQQENGRMPEEEELQALQAAIAQKMGGLAPE